MTKIFISHSTADGDFAIKLMDMLQGQFNLRRQDFFLTSDEELMVGGNWIEQIRQGMQDASIVLPIITPNYLDSQFCLCELGAAWVNQQALVPVIIPPLNYKALDNTPYRSWMQAITLSSVDDLSRLAQAMIDRNVGNGTFNMVRFNTRATNLYNAEVLPLVKSIESREIVSLAVVKELRERINMTQEAYEQAEQELNKLKEENEALRNMKDKEEIKAYDFQQMNEWDTFINAVELVRTYLKPMDRLVISILYQFYKGTIGDRGFIGEQHDLSQLKRLQSEGWIIWDDDEGWTPDRDHTPIKNALSALDNLDDIIRSMEGIIEERFEHEYGDVRMSLKYSTFWSEVLGEEIQHSE